jgi:hypothetical protein
MRMVILGGAAGYGDAITNITSLVRTAVLVLPPPGAVTLLMFCYF